MKIEFPKQKLHNFSAGPAILPEEVFHEAAQAVLDFQGKGLSLLEISHRDKAFVAVMEEARALVLELLGLNPNQYSAIFLQGGASSQFYHIPMAFLNQNASAAYINTGVWSTKAIKEAQLFGTADVIASSEDIQFNHIPKEGKVDHHQYVHFTSNNTIYGTQVQEMEQFEWWGTTCPKVCDMSSDIFSRPIPASEFDLIYAGAQKNLGPAGATLVILKKEGMKYANRPIPSMLNYHQHIDKDSMLNTPPVFAVFVSLLTLRWIKKNGGLVSIQQKNEEKARVLYQYLDQSSLFSGTAVKEDRSLMNATFVCPTEYEQAFLTFASQHDISGIKGHRSVGGFRASMYNAMQQSSVQYLVDVMKDFEQQKG